MSLLRDSALNRNKATDRFSIIIDIHHISYNKVNPVETYYIHVKTEFLARPWVDFNAV